MVVVVAVAVVVVVAAAVVVAAVVAVVIVVAVAAEALAVVVVAVIIVVAVAAGALVVVVVASVWMGASVVCSWTDQCCVQLWTHLLSWVVKRRAVEGEEPSGYVPRQLLQPGCVCCLDVITARVGECACG
jgi:hypothetical protein